jgi:hypothetical protein
MYVGIHCFNKEPGSILRSAKICCRCILGLMCSEPAVLDVLWGGNMELARRNQEVWPYAPYVVQS